MNKINDFIISKTNALPLAGFGESDKDPEEGIKVLYQLIHLTSNSWFPTAPTAYSPSLPFLAIVC
jgi:hypothetical protein